MLFITLHGGKPGETPHKNNVHAYHKDGTKITSCVLDETKDLILDELRSIRLVGKHLYVVNANQTENSLLCYEGSETSYKFISRFASRQTCPGILHPFDFTFDGSGHCFISSQDTNVVTRLRVSADGKSSNCAPVAPALPANGTFLPGTFVPSSVGSLSGAATTPVPPPAGLEYSAQGAKKHSVRGLIWANDALYVADQPAGRVKVYDATGKFLGQSNSVESPVHLVTHDGVLYVTGGNEILSAKLTRPAGDFTLSAMKDLKIKNASGMAFGDSGHVYVASRTENIILKFDSNFKPMHFDCKLTDNPEFLLHI